MKKYHSKTILTAFFLLLSTVANTWSITLRASTQPTQEDTYYKLYYRGADFSDE